MSGFNMCSHLVIHVKDLKSDALFAHFRVLPGLTTASDTQCQSEQFEILSQSAEQRCCLILDPRNDSPIFALYDPIISHLSK